MLRFPKEFQWGAATASYQVEGAVSEDGRGESIWDRFSRTPGKVQNGDTGDTACDHYHRFPEDVKLMADIGIKAYRFSIAWPRIFPDGSGRANPEGLDFYSRLLDELQAHGIQPVPTLYHWDLPQVLEDKGGWPHRDTAYYFRDYAAHVFEAFRDRVSMWITHNEPWCASMLGYGFGVHAPGKQDFPAAMAAAHHLLLSHGLAVQAFRGLESTGQIGITLNLTPQYPASDDADDRAAARRADGFSNRWFLDPVFRGAYPQDMLGVLAEVQAAPPIEDDDLRVISAPLDFLGVNYYSRAIVGHGDQPPLHMEMKPPVYPVTKMDWEVYPDGLYRLLMRLHEDYGPIPLYVTENGACYEDTMVSGRVHDQARTQYLQSHFAAALRAIEQGVPLQGYYVWSLLDNFEWAHGYERRFGIVHVDFADQKRTLKDSALWYKKFLGQQLG